MPDKSFTEEEIAYLRENDAVCNVTTRRITYSDAFKRDSLERYLRGESPAHIFREAGLPPELIGYKRIERAFSRWKENRRKILGREVPAESIADAITERRRGAGTSPVGFSSVCGGVGVGASASASGSSVSASTDIRDILIVQQIHRISELEQQIEALQSVIDEAKAVGDASGVTAKPEDAATPADPDA